MTAADTWTIIVTALDKASVPFLNIRKSAQHMAEPLTGFSKMLGDIGETSGLSALADQVEGIAGHLGGLGDAFGALSGSIGMLGGAASAAGLIEMAKHAADYGEDLYEGAKKTGIATDALARLRYVAEQSSVSAETLDKSLEYLNYNIGQAASGHNKEALELFRAMHIAIRDGNGHLRTAADIWGELSDAFARNANVAEKTTAARALMGRSGQEMIPVLELGRDKTNELSEEFDRLHGRMDASATLADHLAHQSWHELTIAAEGLGDAIGEHLTPILKPLIDGLSHLASGNRDVVASFSGVALGVATLALAAKPVVALVGGLGSGLATLGTLAGVVVAPIVDFTEALWLGFSAFEAFDLAAAANPFGIAVLAATALAGVAYEIYEHWEPVKDFVVGLWDYIGQAFRYGMEHVVQYLGPIGLLAHEIYENWGPLTRFFESLWTGVVHWFDWAWEKIEPIVQPILAAAEWAGAKLVGGAQWAGHQVVAGVEATARHGHDILHAPAGATFARPLAGANVPLDRPVMHVQVDFNNAPAGMRIQTDASGPVSHEVNVGQAWNPAF